MGVGRDDPALYLLFGDYYLQYVQCDGQHTGEEMKMLRIGLIGCGYMGGMHSACYQAIEGAKVVAVADIRAEKAQAIADVHGAKIFETGMDLINEAEVDVIDVCLPTYLHTEHAVAAMKKGRDVFIEKPVCLTREEGELLLQTQKPLQRVRLTHLFSQVKQLPLLSEKQFS